MKHIKLFEGFHGGVNYDEQIESELKDKYGDINKLTPYVLDLPHIDGRADVQMDMSGKVHVTDVTSKEKKLYADIDKFISAIRI